MTPPVAAKAASGNLRLVQDQGKSTITTIVSNSNSFPKRIR
jgi:hypothetical protein